MIDLVFDGMLAVSAVASVMLGIAARFKKDWWNLRSALQFNSPAKRIKRNNLNQSYEECPGSTKD